MRRLGLILLLTTCAHAPVTPAAREEPSPAVALVRELSTDIGPRFSGTAGNARAIAWAVEKMRSLGLANVRAEPVTVPHWVRGAASCEVVGAAPRALSLTALGGSIGTADGGVEAEVVEVDSLKALAALPDERVRGRIVFYNRTPDRNPHGSGYGDVVPIRRDGPTAAAKKGAVAMLMRSVSTATSGGPHTGGTAHGPDAVRIPAAALAVEDAAFLHAAVGQGTVRLHLALGCRELEPAQSANVVGEVVGSDPLAQIVLLGAHLDSWDITPGALDDGAGVAIVLDVARTIRTLHPRRTLRVVLFANEEFGLDGAHTYATAHQDELAKHAIALEMDRGAGRVLALSYLAGPEADAVFTALPPLGIPAAHRSDEHGADLWPLRKAGVPVMELEQDATAYFDVHHSIDDTFDKVEAGALQQAVTVTTQLIAAITQSSADLGRVPKDKR